MGCSKSKEAVETKDNCIKKVKPSGSTKNDAIHTAPLGNDAKISDGNNTNDFNAITDPGKPNTNRKESGNSPIQVIPDSNVVKENVAPGDNHFEIDVNQGTKIGEEIKNADNQALEYHHPGIIKKVNFQTGKETANANQAPEFHHPGMVKNIQTGNEIANVNQATETHPGIVEEVHIQTGNRIANSNQVPEVHPGIVEEVHIQTGDETANANQIPEGYKPKTIENEIIETGNDIVKANQALEDNLEMIVKEGAQAGKQDNVKKIDNNIETDKKVENVVVFEDKKDAPGEEDDTQMDAAEVGPIKLDAETIESMISEGISGRSDYQTPHSIADESNENDETVVVVEENKESYEELKTRPEENMVDPLNEGNVAVSSVEAQALGIPQEEGILNGEVIVAENLREDEKN